MSVKVEDPPQQRQFLQDDSKAINIPLLRSTRRRTVHPQEFWRRPQLPYTRASRSTVVHVISRYTDVTLNMSTAESQSPLSPNKTEVKILCYEPEPQSSAAVVQWEEPQCQVITHKQLLQSQAEVRGQTCCFKHLLNVFL